MAYTLIWSPKSRDDLKQLEAGIAKRIIVKVDELALAPHHFAEKLSSVDCWKLRVGDYRVLFDISEKEKEIQVLKVGHRKKVYK